MQFRSTCIEACNNLACGYGNNSCLCSVGCTPDKLNDHVCHPECGTQKCSFQNHVCGDCAYDCFDSMIGNEFVILNAITKTVILTHKTVLVLQDATVFIILQLKHGPEIMILVI